jgi:hypothetical protein
MENIYDNLGWKTGILLRRFVRVLNEGKIEGLIKRRLPVRRLDVHDVGGLTFRRLIRIDGSFDEFFGRVASKYPITVKRSSIYMRWRFENHPIFNYHTFVSRDTRIKAFIVVRIEESSGYKIARIVDFMSDDEAEVFTLTKVIEFCKDNEVDLADFYFSGNFHEEALGSVGFVEADNEPYSLIPALFSPIDFREHTLNLAFRSPVRYKPSNWYVTKADGDQDRPNIPKKSLGEQS